MNETSTKVKAPSFCKKDYSDEGVASFTFGNGTVVECDTSTLSDEQKFNLMMHGLLQKVGDSYASAKGDFTFGIAAAQKVVGQLANDQWTASHASAGEGTPKTGELAQAIANLKKLDVATVTTAVNAATDDQRKAWRKNAAIAAEIARMRAEKAAARAATAETAGSVDDIEL